MGRYFGDNLARLLGLHRLTSRSAGQLIGVSPQTLSEWQHNKREPNLSILLRLADFFEIRSDLLVSAPFPELLGELADVERFHRVEEKIRDKRRHVRAVRPEGDDAAAERRSTRS